MDNAAKRWWKDLSDTEQDVLIAMIFSMDGEDFRQFGVKMTDEGLYINA